MPRHTFVLMPFAKSFDSIWETVIRPTVQAAGDHAARADDFFAPGTIITDIFSSIRNSDYVIADLTGRNPNVFYELGYAMALERPAVLLTQSIDDVPFDVRHLRIIPYSDSVAGAAALRQALARSIAALA